MAGLFDLIKIYKREWEEISTRKFDEKECEQISDVTVVASKYGKSVMFFIPGKGKAFIPLEPLANAELGAKLDIHEIELVNLKYVGDDPNQTKKNIMRIRVPEKSDTMDVVDFNNPFGV
jgi:hypothetical protein